MDNFEQAMQQMAQMTEEDRICICGGCPTYNDCARENEELLYCAFGKMIRWFNSRIWYLWQTLQE